MDLDLPRSWLGASGDILPVLRENTSPANAWAAGLANPEARVVRAPLAPFLDVAAVLDRPDYRLFVNAGHLARWEVDGDTVLEQARANLPAAEGLRPWPEADGVWQIAAGDGYESSRLMLPGFLTAFDEQVRGRPIAFVPDARTLLITGSEQGLPLEAALTAAWNTFHEAGTPVSCAPYTVTDHGRIVAWQPGPDHPLVHRVATAHRFFAGHVYRRAQDILAQHLLDEERPEYPSVYSLIRLPGGRVVSFAALPDGPTLLPQVDLVVLGRPGPDLLDTAPAVPWTVLARAGHLGEAEDGLSPIRYRVDGRAIDPESFRDQAVDPRAFTAG